MRPSTKVVATGLFLVVEAPQDMVRVASNGDEQLVVSSYSQGLNRRKICRQVATPPQSSQEPLIPRFVLSGCKPHLAGEAYSSGICCTGFHSHSASLTGTRLGVAVLVWLGALLSARALLPSLFLCRPSYTPVLC